MSSFAPAQIQPPLLHGLRRTQARGATPPGPWSSPRQRLRQLAAARSLRGPSRQPRLSAQQKDSLAPKKSQQRPTWTPTHIQNHCPLGAFCRFGEVQVILLDSLSTGPSTLLVRFWVAPIVRRARWVSHARYSLRVQSTKLQWM